MLTSYRTSDCAIYSDDATGMLGEVLVDGGDQPGGNVTEQDVQSKVKGKILSMVCFDREMDVSLSRRR